MIVPEKLTHAEILRAIEETAEPLLESVQLFDLFSSEANSSALPESHSHIRLTYRD